MKPIKETLHHREAFEYYFNLGSNRSSVAVVQQFGVSTRAVENWSVAFEWQRRIADREGRLATALSRKNENAYVAMKRRQLALIQKLNMLIEYEVDRGAIRPTVSDFIRLAVYEQELLKPESAESQPQTFFDWAQQHFAKEKEKQRLQAQAAVDTSSQTSATESQAS